MTGIHPISFDPRRNLAWLRGGTALYMASAISILVGVLQIIVPLYEKPDLLLARPFEKLYCLAALNAYELVLLGVLLLILLWRKVTDDAVALVLLVAAFLVGSGIALDAIAPNEGSGFVGLALGGVMAVLAAGKLYALRAHVVGPFGPLMLAGIATALTWNFLMPGVLGLAIYRRWGDGRLVPLWLAGQGAVLLGGGLLVVAAARLRTGEMAAADRGRPFVRTGPMRWVFAALVLAGSLTHAYALGWAFSLPLKLGDLLPALGVGSLLAAELTRAYRGPRNDADAAYALVPLFAVLVALLSGGYTAVPYPPGAGAEAGDTLRWALGLVGYPPMFAAWMGAALAGFAWRNGRGPVAVIALVYATFAALTWGVAPDLQEGLDLNWLAAGLLLTGVLATAAALCRSPGAAAVAVTVLALGVAVSPRLDAYLRARGIESWAVALVVLGLGLQAIHAAFRRRGLFGTRPLTYAGAFLLVVGLLYGAARAGSAWDYPLTAALAFLAWEAALAAWHRDPWLFAPAAVPLAAAVYAALQHRRGWLFVVASFLMLGLGAAVSLRKRAAATAEPVRDKPDEYVWS